MTGPASSDPTPSDPASDPLAAPPTPRDKATTGSAELRAAARDLVDVGILIHEAAAHATTALTDKAVLAAIPRSFVAGCLTQRALLKTVTNRDGLGYAVTGNRLATLAAKAGAMAGAESLAVRVLATSLRLRIAAVALDHPELVTDPMLGRLVQAAAEDRDLEAVRALRALLKDRGAVRTLSALAPVFGEVLALRALLDENPLNDAAAWLIATGRGYATADPITGMSNRAVAVLDKGEGAARRVESGVPLNDHGSLLAFLGNISALGTKGRVLVQSVEGPDGVVRHVLQAPGMRAGTPDNDSPQDLLGAFSSAVLDSSPYSRALTKAVEDYGVPEGDEIALIGHSAGGAAIMNLAQDPGFCARHTVTHAVAVGSPIDFKKPADPRTWVASVTNQHDIIPTLDGQGAGGCFDLHPDWYVVDYFDATHLFPLCHSIEHYMANLAADLPEARRTIDERLGPYRGRVVRSQAYLLFDRVPYAEGLPFQTHGEGTAAPPVRCREGSALTAYFAADAVAAAELLRGSGLGPATGFGGRALVALHVAWNRRTSVGAYRELHLGVVLRSADRGRSGWFTVASVVDGADVCAVAARLWGGVPYELPMEVGLTGRAVNVSAGELLRLRGSLGPWLPHGDRGLVGYARDGDTVLRSRVQARGKGRAHLAPRLRLGVALRAHPLADAFRRLDLDGARPLLCLTSPARQTFTDAAGPVLIT
ncbi:hypothetical protein AB0B45_30565 [Nonomuraea sp. NPDC049152]|uniref:hypothetical protein n=1 Tax=Nonomuraea sp. NPDC049152 TaxID=3154350 RepID=UPI00340BD1B5